MTRSEIRKLHQEAVKAWRWRSLREVCSEPQQVRGAGEAASGSEEMKPYPGQCRGMAVEIPARLLRELFRYGHGRALTLSQTITALLRADDNEGERRRIA